MEVMQQLADTLDCNGIEQDIAQLSASIPHAISIQRLPLKGINHKPRKVPCEPLCTAVYSRPPLTAKWRINSFSGITIGQHRETPDYDAIDPPDSPDPQETSIFTFPRGATPGTCLHAIFEQWEFGSTDRKALHALVEQKLSVHGIDTNWTTVVAGMVETTVNKILDNKGVRLADLYQHSRISELEFTFPR